MGTLKRFVMVGLVLGGTVAAIAPHAQAQESGRIAKIKVQPDYPDLARRMAIGGTVKVQLTVAPNGTVKDAKLIGGHPVLASSVLQAVKKWRFEARPQETIENLQFHFDPSQ